MPSCFSTFLGRTDEFPSKLQGVLKIFGDPVKMGTRGFHFGGPFSHDTVRERERSGNVQCYVRFGAWLYVIEHVTVSLVQNTLLLVQLHQIALSILPILV